MAEKTNIKAARPRGSALDLPMAALAGGSVGFFVCAMPGDLFGSVIAATGLPALVSAAQPPLGATARFAAALAAALAVFGAVWALLRALGPKPAIVIRPFAETAAETPRVQRDRIQPQEPARHPLRAATDFGVPLDAAPADRGEPVEVSEIEDVDYEAEWERPTPRFLQASVDEVTDETAPVVEDEPEPVEDAADLPFWLPNDAAEDEDTVLELETVEPQSDGSPVILPFWAQQTEPQAAEEPAAATEPSLDQLANRLEGGLIRRKRDGRSTRPRGGNADGRLRTALDELTRMSKRS